MHPLSAQSIRRSLAPHKTPRPCTVEPLERRQLFAVTYSISLPGAGPITTWANNWSNSFKAYSATYTGSDGMVSIPLNGIDKLGSAYDTPGWQQWTTGDTFLGTYNPASGVRTGASKFVNNVVSMQQTSGASPAANIYKYRGSISSTAQEQMAIILRNTSGQYYWPSDGQVVNGKVVQLAIRMNGFVQAGVSLIQAPVPATITSSAYPYASTASITVADNNPNLYQAHTNTGVSDPYSGDRSATAAVMDLSNNTTAYAGDGYIYTYAVQQGTGFFEKYAFVGRATPANFSTPAAWEWWAPTFNRWISVSGTSPGLAVATPMKTTSNGKVNDAASEFSVFQMPDGRFAMVYDQNDISGKIVARYAPAGHPEGPWSSPTVIYTIPTPDSGNGQLGLRALPRGFSGTDWSYVTYGAKVHPQLSKAPTGTGASRAGRLLLSFHLQTWGPAGQFSPEFSYGDIYRPRFLELSLVGKDDTIAKPLEALPDGSTPTIKSANTSGNGSTTSIPSTRTPTTSALASFSRTKLTVPHTRPFPLTSDAGVLA